MYTSLINVDDVGVVVEQVFFVELELLPLLLDLVSVVVLAEVVPAAAAVAVLVVAVLLLGGCCPSVVHCGCSRIVGIGSGLRSSLLDNVVVIVDLVVVVADFASVVDSVAVAPPRPPLGAADVVIVVRRVTSTWSSTWSSSPSLVVGGAG